MSCKTLCRQNAKKHKYLDQLEESNSLHDDDDDIVPYSGNRRWESNEESKLGSKLGALYKHSSGIPKNGFKAHDMDTKGRTYRRAKKIFNDIYNELCNIFVPDDPDICHSFLMKDKDINVNSGLALLQNNLIDLYFHGTNDVSTICGSVIAQSYPMERSIQLLQDAFEGVNLSNFRAIPSSRINLGRKRMTSLRAKFDMLMKKEDISCVRRKYPFRVKPYMIATAIQYLQEQLPVIAGRTRNAKIDGHIFRNLPVHSIGGKSFILLFEQYKILHPNKKRRIGRTNFITVGKMLCMRGELKTGLSSYYVCVRDANRIYRRMLARLGEIEGIVGLQGGDIAPNITRLEELWADTEKFVQYEYSAKHIDIHSTCKSHCCMFALNKSNECTHTHSDLTCQKCSSPFVAIEETETLLTCILDQLSHERIEERMELISMKKAQEKVFQPVLKSYMAHRVRAVAQFVKIEKEKTQFTDKRCGLWFDHKQKVLPIRFREG